MNRCPVIFVSIHCKQWATFSKRWQLAAAPKGTCVCTKNFPWNLKPIRNYWSFLIGKFLKACLISILAAHKGSLSCRAHAIAATILTPEYFTFLFSGGTRVFTPFWGWSYRYEKSWINYFFSTDVNFLTKLMGNTSKLGKGLFLNRPMTAPFRISSWIKSHVVSGSVWTNFPFGGSGQGRGGADRPRLKPLMTVSTSCLSGCAHRQECSLCHETGVASLYTLRSTKTKPKCLLAWFICQETHHCTPWTLQVLI